MRLLGLKHKFKVDRETNLGYTLILNNEEYFLHHNECGGRTPSIGSTIEAFLYTDKKNRLAATLLEPTVTLDEIGFGTVVAVNKELGLFVNIGISKDILFSKDELPFVFKQWPIEGDKVIVEMKEKQDRLVLKMATIAQINQRRESDTEIPEGTRLNAVVYRITEDGINLVTDDFNSIFVYKTNYRKLFRLGEAATVTIIKKSENGYSGTMIENKEYQISEDKKAILAYLEKNFGVMMITENSSPDLIVRALHMSKAAFKKAIGGLLREKKIIILDDRITLNDLNEF